MPQKMTGLTQRHSAMRSRTKPDSSNRSLASTPRAWRRDHAGTPSPIGSDERGLPDFHGRLLVGEGLWKSGRRALFQIRSSASS
jgi:hypothetical protein